MARTSWLGVLAIFLALVALPSAEGSPSCLSFNLSDAELALDSVKKAADYLNLTSSTDLYVTISDIVDAVSSTSQTPPTDFLGVGAACLARLRFSLTEVAILLAKDPGASRQQITFNETMAALFSESIRVIVETRLPAVDQHLDSIGVPGNLSVKHAADGTGQNLSNTTVLSIILKALNHPDVTALEVALGGQHLRGKFDGLEFTAQQLATILSLDVAVLQNATIRQWLRFAFVADVMTRKTRPLFEGDVTSLIENRQELESVHLLTFLLRRVWSRPSILALTISVPVDNFRVFNFVLEELAEQKKRNVSEVMVLPVYPDLVTLILNPAEDFLEIQARKDVEEALEMILKEYNVTLVAISEYFGLTLIYVHRLDLFRLEALCARYTLYRYSVNLGLTFAEIGVKVGKKEGELRNISVQDFQMVVRRLMIATALERLSVMMGVSQDYLVNILNFQRPLYMLSLSDLDGLMVKTRRTILDLRAVLRTRHLSFVAVVHGFSLNQVYNFTLETFVTNVLRLDVEAFFGFLGVQYKSSYLNILRDYRLKRLEFIFQWNANLRIRRFYVFKLPFRWIILRIIDLVERDVDECRSVLLNRCYGQARCINLPGSFQCECPPGGFRGRYCEDINECTEGNFTCPNNSHCFNIDGSYRCRCNRGYQNIDDSCVDIDECVDNPCFRMVCKNTPGSFTCQCPDGYGYDHFRKRCRDINECRLDPTPCEAITNHSSCNNWPGGYSCGCADGFYNKTYSDGSPANCTDIDECERNIDRCHSNAKCNNTLGAYKCTCKEGYQGDGRDCREKRFVLIAWPFFSFTGNEPVRIFVPGDFPYFGKLYKWLYINPNGMISVGKRYRRATPRSLASINRNILAVFWAATDFGRDSRVIYKTFSRGEELARVNERINECANLSGSFTGTWMLVVTWQKVSPFARFTRGFLWRRTTYNPYLDEQSTYQAVLVTDGSRAYAIYSYEQGGMRWSRTWLERSCVVGYGTKTKRNHYQAPGSFSSEIFSIDSQSFVDKRGTSRRGMICLSLSDDNVEPEPPTPEQECLRWINNEPDPEWAEELPGECPARRREATRRGGYRRVSRTRRVDCYEPRFPTRSGASLQCCYNRRNGACLSKQPASGRAYRAHYKSPAKRQEADEWPYEKCCVDSSTYCSLFYDKRPASRCATRAPPPQPRPCRGFLCGIIIVVFRPRRPRFRRPRPTRGFGDPHFMTLDGKSYTFNGLGDYALLHGTNDTVRIHCRTGRVPQPSGEPSNATAFTGFAFKADGGDIVQVLYDESVHGNMSITVSSSTCATYGLDNFTEAVDFTSVSLEKSEEVANTLVVSLPEGLMVELKPGPGLLQVTVYVPASMENNTKGLLGNYNGNAEDDFEFRNGSMLGPDSTEEQLFVFGQSWKVLDEERLFMNSTCAKQNVFYDPEFVPAFFNPADLGALNASAVEICGDDKQCLYDIAQSKNLALGLSTRSFEAESEKEDEAFDNNPPEITGPTEVEAFVGEPLVFTINASDPDNDPVILASDGLPEGATFNNISGLFNWTAQNITNLTLEFDATDSKGDAASWEVIVNLCKCRYRDQCDYDNYVGDSTGTLRVVGCNCSDQYTGDFCETEVDPCSDGPCYEGSNCTTKRNPFGFECSPCPDGLTGNGETCYDLDECTNQTLSGCNQTCNNTFGSWECSCRDGFTSRENGKYCDDIDECSSQCKGNNTVCTNYPGGFNCTCKSGFSGDPFDSCADIDECRDGGEAECSQECTNTVGSYYCTCAKGFKLSDNNETCEDINECDSFADHNCEQACDNKVGSYVCACRLGFELNPDNVTCRVGEASACIGNSGGCSDLCVNVSGLVQCSCNKGFTLTGDGRTCQDIDECLGNHGCQQGCNNTRGSYNCTCPSGYQLQSDQRTCRDIDECSQQNGGCSQECVNTTGSYYCRCKQGYRLQNDSRTCMDINECLANHNCSDQCVNTPGSFRCGCPPGYELKSDQRNCRDVDECATNSTLCGGGTCVNARGGYRCNCPGNRFVINGVCTRMKVFRWATKLQKVGGKNIEWNNSLSDEKSVLFLDTAAKVEGEVNSYMGSKRRSFKGSKVERFWQGSVMADVSLNFDSDSSVTPSDIGSDLPQNGSIGDLDFDASSSQVTDVNECAEDLDNCHKYAVCTNTQGSFTCQCKEGYIGDGVSCGLENPTEADDDKLKVFAIAAGCVLLLLLIMLLVVYCVYQHKKRRKYEAAALNGSGRISTVPKMRPDMADTPEKNRKKQAVAGHRFRDSGDYDYASPYEGTELKTRSVQPEPTYDNPDTMTSHPGGKGCHTYDNPGASCDD